MDSKTTSSAQNSSSKLHAAARSDPAGAVPQLDASILAALPADSEVISVTRHGDTHWSTGLRVDTRTQNGDKSYFVKIIDREELLGMAEAEYEGQKAIYSVTPENSVKPVSWGFVDSTRTKSWFLAEYRSLRAGPPPLELLLPVVRRLHQESASSTGQFGFHVTSFYGPPPMQVGWLDNWEQFWIREFRSGLAYAEAKLGRDDELLALAEEFIQKVAVRLLRPLQTGGRSIRPSLCHGDLWDGNIQTDADSGQPVIFDPCVFYGHHEMDFQSMRDPRYTVGREFIDLYRETFGASEPVEDFEGRIALYAVRTDIMTASMWPKRLSLIDKAKGEMRRLLDEYSDGIDGFKGSLEPTGMSNMEDWTAVSTKDASVGPIQAAQADGELLTADAIVPSSAEDSSLQKTKAESEFHGQGSKSATNSRKRRLSLKLNYFKNMVRELKRGRVR